MFSGEQIDIGEAVRDGMLLSLPMKNLCSDACKGLCPVCGTDLNYDQCGCDGEEADPRMQRLRDWFKEVNGDGGSEKKDF